MKPNPVKTKLLAGEPVFGTFGWEFLVPGLPQIVKAAGAEFLLLDMEHSGASYETIKSQAELLFFITPRIRAAEPVVAVPGAGNRHGRSGRAAGDRQRAAVG